MEGGLPRYDMSNCSRGVCVQWHAMQGSGIHRVHQWDRTTHTKAVTSTDCTTYLITPTMKRLMLHNASFYSSESLDMIGSSLISRQRSV